MERDVIRHGDILFRPRERSLDGLTLRPGTIVRRGEVTGHAHRITEGEARILEEYETAWTREGKAQRLKGEYLDVLQTATITHEEHKPLTIGPGLWEIIQAREFDYVGATIRRVTD